MLVARQAKHRLPFPLLTDPKGELRAAFGASLGSCASAAPKCTLTHALRTTGIPADLMGLLPGRQTYVFGPDGVVKLVFNSQARLGVVECGVRRARVLTRHARRS